MTLIMPWMRPAFAALVLGFFPTAPVLAAPCDGMHDLLAFIAARTSYAVPTTCPAMDRLDVLQTDAALRSQAGAYFPVTGRIALAADLDLTTAYGRSYLLHELVHAAQHQAGVQHRVRCEAELEREAYALQAAYLRAHGEGREALILSWLAEGLTRCAGTPAPAEY